MIEDIFLDLKNMSIKMERHEHYDWNRYLNLLKKAHIKAHDLEILEHWL